MVFVAADSTAGNVGMKGSAFRSTETKPTERNYFLESYSG